MFLQFEEVSKRNQKIKNLWHPSEAMKRCHPSAIRGDSTEEPRGASVCL